MIRIYSIIVIMFLLSYSLGNIYYCVRNGVHLKFRYALVVTCLFTIMFLVIRSKFPDMKYDDINTRMRFFAFWISSFLMTISICYRSLLPNKKSYK